MDDVKLKHQRLKEAASLVVKKQHEYLVAMQAFHHAFVDFAKHRTNGAVARFFGITSAYASQLTGYKKPITYEMAIKVHESPPLKD